MAVVGSPDSIDERSFNTPLTNFRFTSGMMTHAISADRSDFRSSPETSLTPKLNVLRIIRFCVTRWHISHTHTTAICTWPRCIILVACWVSSCREVSASAVLRVSIQDWRPQQEAFSWALFPMEDREEWVDSSSTTPPPVLSTASDILPWSVPIARILFSSRATGHCWGSPAKRGNWGGEAAGGL